MTTYFLTVTDEAGVAIYRDNWVAESDSVSVAILSMVAQAFFHGINYTSEDKRILKLKYTIEDRFGNQFKCGKLQRTLN